MWRGSCAGPLATPEAQTAGGTRGSPVAIRAVVRRWQLEARTRGEVRAQLSVTSPRAARIVALCATGRAGGGVRAASQRSPVPRRDRAGGDRPLHLRWRRAARPRSRPSPAGRGPGQGRPGARGRRGGRGPRGGGPPGAGSPSPGRLGVEDRPSAGRSMARRARPKTSRSRSSSRGPQRAALPPPERALQALERDEQGGGAGRRIRAGRHVERHDRVAELGLVRHPDRLGGVEPRDAAQTHAGERREGVDRRGERPARIADVRPEPDVRPHPSHTAPPDARLGRCRPSPFAFSRRSRRRGGSAGTGSTLLGRSWRSTTGAGSWRPARQTSWSAGAARRDLVRRAAAGAGRGAGAGGGLVVLGSGALPLATAVDRRAFVTAAGSRSRRPRQPRLLGGHRGHRRAADTLRDLPPTCRRTTRCHAGWRRSPAIRCAISAPDAGWRSIWTRRWISSCSRAGAAPAMLAAPRRCRGRPR